MLPQRQCKKCGIEKLLDAFPQYAENAYRWECRACNRSRMSGYYREKRENYSAKSKRHYEKLKLDPVRYRRRIQRKLELDKIRNSDVRDEALAHYGMECACCGESVQRFLTLDHVESDGKDTRKVHGTGLTFYRWLKRNDWPTNIQTLCFNCNLGRALNGGICPHVQKRSTTIPKGSRAKRSEAPGPRKG